MTTICAMTDHIFLDAQYKQPAQHQHLAKHIIISLADDLTVTLDKARKGPCKGAMIDSNVPHTVTSKDERMLVFLIDETSGLAQNMNQQHLFGKPFAEIDEHVVEQIREAYKACLPDHFALKYLQFSNAVFSWLNLNDENAIMTDYRVQKAIECILGAEGIDGAMIPRLCEAAHLSQSRFSHLFKEQTGVPLNSYLALSKLRKAYQALLACGNITEAAMDAGFSTPSHFSAASKKHLGIAASEITGQCKLYVTKD